MFIFIIARLFVCFVVAPRSTNEVVTTKWLREIEICCRRMIHWKVKRMRKTQSVNEETHKGGIKKVFRNIKINRDREITCRFSPFLITILLLQQQQQHTRDLFSSLVLSVQLYLSLARALVLAVTLFSVSAFDGHSSFTKKEMVSLSLDHAIQFYFYSLNHPFNYSSLFLGITWFRTVNIQNICWQTFPMARETHLGFGSIPIFL